MGGAIFMASLDLRTSIRGSVEELYGHAVRYDMSLRFVEPHAADSIVSAVRATEGVGDVEVWSGANAWVKHDDGLLGNGFPWRGSHGTLGCWPFRCSRDGGSALATYGGSW